jgi:hypothetical protein
LTEIEAYDSMRVFLEAYWERGLRQSDEIGGLLGALAPLVDGSSADPAQWYDWLFAVRTVKAREGKRDYLRISGGKP